VHRADIQLRFPVDRAWLGPKTGGFRRTACRSVYSTGAPALYADPVAGIHRAGRVPVTPTPHPANNPRHWANENRSKSQTPFLTPFAHSTTTTGQSGAYFASRFRSRSATLKSAPHARSAPNAVLDLPDRTGQSAAQSNAAEFAKSRLSPVTVSTNAPIPLQPTDSDALPVPSPAPVVQQFDHGVAPTNTITTNSGSEMSTKAASRKRYRD